MKIPNLKKIFSHKSTRVHHSFVIMRPNHDWKVIIYIFVALLLVFFIFSFYFLDRVRKDTLFKVDKSDSAKSSAIDQVLLEKTLTEFKAKSDKRNKFPKDSSLAIDPSK